MTWILIELWSIWFGCLKPLGWFVIVETPTNHHQFVRVLKNRSQIGHLPGKRDENRNHFWTISGADRFSYECPVWCVSFPKEDCGWLIKPSIFHFQFPFSSRWTCSSNFPSGAWSYINFQFGHVFSEGKSYLAGRTIRVILQRAYVPPKAANVKL